MKIDQNPHQNPLYTEPMSVGNLEIRPIDLLEHVLATGATGSGKTRSFVLPLVENVLLRFGGSENQKAGMLLIDAKGDMAELAAECVRRAGREDDLYILGEEGNCWFSLFEQFCGDPTAVANFLFEVLESRCGGSGKGQNDSFWEENARRLLRAAATCAKARFGIELGGLQGITAGINMIISARGSTSSDDDDNSAVPPTSAGDELKALIGDGFVAERISLQEKNEFLEYLTNDVENGTPKTWQTIANMTRNYVAQFSQPALQDLFRVAGGRRKIVPEDLIDEGQLLIVSLSPVIYGEAARPFLIALKKAFCERILQRNHLVTSEGGVLRPINQARPLLYVCDEFHTTLVARGEGSDAFFLDRAREFRCMCVLATQGISAISSVVHHQGMLDHLLNNCRTKFFFSNDCPQTMDYFERLGGDADRKVASVQFQRVPAAPRFRLPNHDFVKQKMTAIVGHSISTRPVPRFSSAALGKLPNGTALVVKKGRKIDRYTMDPQAYSHGKMEAAASIPS